MGDPKAYFKLSFLLQPTAGRSPDGTSCDVKPPHQQSWDPRVGYVSTIIYELFVFVL